MSKYDLSIVVACYNESPHLEESVAEVRATMARTRYTYELIFVEDCGQDNTRDIIETIVKDHPQDIKTYFHKTNQGRGGTVTDGIRMAEGKYVGFLDIDLEVPAHYIPAMVRALEDGYHIATAHRIYQISIRKMFRHITSHGYRCLFRIWTGIDLRDTETGFKFFNREHILPVLNQTTDKGWFWDTEIMVFGLKAGLKIVEIPCLFTHKFQKKSTIRLWRDISDYLVKLYRFKKTLSS